MLYEIKVAIAITVSLTVLYLGVIGGLAIFGGGASLSMVISATPTKLILAGALFVIATLLFINVYFSRK